MATLYQMAMHHMCMAVLFSTKGGNCSSTSELYGLTYRVILSTQTLFARILKGWCRPWLIGVLRHETEHAISIYGTGKFIAAISEVITNNNNHDLPKLKKKFETDYRQTS